MRCQLHIFSIFRIIFLYTLYCVFQVLKIHFNYKHFNSMAKLKLQLRCLVTYLIPGLKLLQGDRFHRQK